MRRSSFQTLTAPAVLAAWSGQVSDVLTGGDVLRDAVADIRRPVYIPT